ncbi:FkbM family methyltransferase [Roseomonas gilardii]|uniref:FkbM family methyltransferase n=1 Tax=Roseomonas gilardii TaxID=257708 RepID=A0ABU3MBB5_9PROT|nr:FkbM family methyltransferase [Roseomonas gilardii]MDT8330154.1 FkbM family methyltransferase [Roseomonas gilardii]
MDLISYAQNQEDVMLWRALQRVENGFYIDVGAAHPEDLSVTRLFYDHGWSGINLEPNNAYFAELQAHRGRDINLPVCATAEPGERVFHEIPGTGLSTLDTSVAEEHARKGWELKERRVPGLTLAQICEQYRPDGPIHFLKIDVEGGEAEVLQGADFSRFRPWILLIEATRPLSQEPDHAVWENGLLAQGYRFAWFDGLNRFYVADERAAALLPYFTVQPNVFDGFLRAADLLQRHRDSETYAANEREARLRAEADRDRVEQARQKAEADRDHAEQARQKAEADRDQAEQARRKAEADRDRAEMASQKAEEAHALLLTAHKAALSSLEEAGTRRGEAEQRALSLREKMAGLEEALRDAGARARQMEQKAAAAGERERKAHAEYMVLRETLIAQTASAAEGTGIRIGQALEHAEAAHRRLSEVMEERAQLEARLQEAEHRYVAAEVMNRAYHTSTSWRLTRPLRGVIYLLRRQIGLKDVGLYASRRVLPKLRGVHAGDDAKQVQGITEMPAPDETPALALPLPEVPSPAEAMPAREQDLSLRGQYVRRLLSHRLSSDARQGHPIMPAG